MTQLASVFGNFKADGILGLAWPGLSVDNLPTWFNQLYEQKGITDHLLSFYLTDKPNAAGSELVLGGIDSNHYTGEITYTPVILKEWWVINVQNIQLGGNTVTNGNAVKGIVDTGTTFIVGSYDIIQRIQNRLGNRQRVPCNQVSSLPTLSFKIEGKDFPVPPKAYVLKVTEFGRSVCLLGFGATQFPPRLGDVVIIGDGFLKEYYSVFDTGNARVGFAKAN